MKQYEWVSGILTHGDQKIHCLRAGEGNKLLITFHGFAFDAGQFEFLAPSLGKDYVIVSIDLPGHGKTEWSKKYMMPADVMAIVQGIKNDIGVDQFSLLAYSIGAKAALTVVGLQADWVDKLILLAPDGTKKYFSYRMATRNIIGRLIFKQILNHPEAWVKRLDFLARIGLVGSEVLKIAEATLLDERMNRQIAYVWPVMSRLIPIIPVVKFNIKKQGIETHVFVGKQDQLIRVKAAKKFLKGLKTGHLHVLNKGHNVLTPDILAHLQRVLQEAQMS